MRKRNTDINGNPFGTLKRREVWQKAKRISSLSDDLRKDRYGNHIKYSEYGNTRSNYGWEVDHIHPVSKGGADHIDNLQPLQWEVNRKKGDKVKFKNIF